MSGLPFGVIMSKPVLNCFMLLALGISLASCRDSKTLEENQQLKAHVLQLQKDAGDLGNRVDVLTKENADLNAQIEQLKKKPAGKKKNCKAEISSKEFAAAKPPLELTRCEADAGDISSQIRIQSHRIPCDASESSKVRHGHVGELDAQAGGRTHAANHSSNARCLADFQCEINIASSGHGPRRLDEAAIQADGADDSRKFQTRVGHHPGWYPAAQATESPSLLLVRSHRNLLYFRQLILHGLRSAARCFGLAALLVNRLRNWLRTVIKAFVTINTVKREQPE